MSCFRCENLDEHVSFRTRGELFRAIGVIRRAVFSNAIEEIEVDATKGKMAFGDLSENGPLDDLLLYKFRCRGCGQTFRLEAETYHGSGGSWERTAS